MYFLNIITCTCSIILWFSMFHWGFVVKENHGGFVLNLGYWMLYMLMVLIITVNCPSVLTWVSGKLLFNRIRHNTKDMVGNHDSKHHPVFLYIQQQFSDLLDLIGTVRWGPVSNWFPNPSSLLIHFQLLAICLSKFAIPAICASWKRSPKGKHNAKKCLWVQLN